MQWNKLWLVFQICMKKRITRPEFILVNKTIFFPKKGILAQSDDAKGKRINATIGIALEENLTPMRLKPIAKLVKLRL